MIDFDRSRAELTAATATIADVVATTNPDLPIPTCAEWTLLDLVRHLGRGHRWAAEITEKRPDRLLPMPTVEPPEDAAGRAAWLVEGVRRLNAAAVEVGETGAVWTWSADRTPRFWVRRMAHDTLIHRVDVDLALGREPAVAADLAADGVTDLLQTIATLSPIAELGKFQQLRGAGETLHFHATDVDGEWQVLRGPGGVSWEFGHGKADVAVRGTARDLLLVLNRRLDPDRADLTVFGERALFDHWLEHSAF